MFGGVMVWTLRFFKNIPEVIRLVQDLIRSFNKKYFDNCKFLGLKSILGIFSVGNLFSV